VLTPGGWDLRGTALRLPWPQSVAGLRCPDVGTVDGFWAFELERRGASEVVASDVLDATQLDHFAADRLRSCSGHGPSCATERLRPRPDRSRRVRPRGDGLRVADAL